MMMIHGYNGDDYSNDDKNGIGDNGNSDDKTMLRLWYGW